MSNIPPVTPAQIEADIQALETALTATAADVVTVTDAQSTLSSALATQATDLTTAAAAYQTLLSDLAAYYAQGGGTPPLSPAIRAKLTWIGKRP